MLLLNERLLSKRVEFDDSSFFLVAIQTLNLFANRAKYRNDLYIFINNLFKSHNKILW